MSGACVKPVRACVSCGAFKEVGRFGVSTLTRDGVQVECLPCQEGRDRARALDGETGERSWPLPEERRHRTPRVRRSPMQSSLDDRLRARPATGLMPVE